MFFNFLFILGLGFFFYFFLHFEIIASTKKKQQAKKRVLRLLFLNAKQRSVQILSSRSLSSNGTLPPAFKQNIYYTCMRIHVSVINKERKQQGIGRLHT